MRAAILLGGVAIAALAAFVVRDRWRAHAPTRAIGFVAETAGVRRGLAVRRRGAVVGHVAAVTRRDSLLRLEIVLGEGAPPLQRGDRLRFVRTPLGEVRPLEVVAAASEAPPLPEGDSLPAAPSLDEADSTRQALEALPAVVRDAGHGARRAVELVKRHPSLWSDTARR